MATYRDSFTFIIIIIEYITTQISTNELFFIVIILSKYSYFTSLNSQQLRYALIKLLLKLLLFFVCLLSTLM
jgi:hypothetical protein